MTLLGEYDLEVSKDVKKVAQKVAKFHGDIVKGSPVDMGDFRSAWELIQKGELSWTIYNPQEYGYILWNGRKTINGKTYGSLQGWGLHGGDELLMKFKEELKRDTI